MATNTETMFQEILDILRSIEKRLSNIEKGNNSDKSSVSSNIGTKIKIKKSKQKTVTVKTGSINMTIHPNGCTLTGDTFDKKHIIKGCKGWYSPTIKGWTVKSNNVETLQQQLEETTKDLSISHESSVLDGIDTDYKPKGSKQSTKKEKSVSSSSFNGDALDFLDDSD